MVQPPIILTGSPELAVADDNPVVAGVAAFISSTSLADHAAAMPRASSTSWPRSRPSSRSTTREVSPKSSLDVHLPAPACTLPALAAPVPQRLGATPLPVVQPIPAPTQDAARALDGWVRLVSQPLLMVSEPHLVPEVQERSRSVMERIQALADMTDSTVFDVLRRLSDGERASAALAEAATEIRLRALFAQELPGTPISLSAALHLHLPETTWRQAIDEVLHEGCSDSQLASRVYWRAYAKSERLRELRQPPPQPTRRESLRRSVSSAAAVPQTPKGI